MTNSDDGRYVVHTDWLDDEPYVVDTHSFGYSLFQIVKGVILMGIAFVGAIVLWAAFKATFFG